jgi:hypothetical protein
METTLNVSHDILKTIEAEAGRYGISRSRMIGILLKMVLDDASMLVRTGRMVQYQDRREREEWRRIHVCFNEAEYEYFLDLRKLCKMSLSLILAYAVRKFLKKCNVTDNNRYNTYSIIKENIGTTTGWILLWGAPPAHR